MSRLVMLAFSLVAAGLACGGERPALGATRRGAASDAQAPEPRFVAVSAGATSTCALTDRGRAYCWGSDSAGQLGTGATGPSSSTPVALRGPAFTAITVGQDHACGLSGDGVAYCWGSNEQGALGSGQRATINPRPTPVAGKARFQSIDAGTTRTCAVTRQGTVYCWGRFSVPSADPAGRSASVPTPVAGSIRYRSVSVGLSHACGIGADGGISCWGLNHFGELGRGPPGATFSNQSPGSPTLAAKFVSVDVSATGSCAVTADGVAYCWGRNMFGELGNGTSTEQYTPNPVPGRVVGSQRWRQVSTGGGYTCGLTVEGAVNCWGLNAPNVFLLGSDSAPDVCVGPPPRPCSTKPIAVAGGLRFSDVSAGGTHSCGVSDGHIFCWGTNDYGELGTGSTEAAVNPARVVFGAAPAPPPSEQSLGQPESTPADAPRAVAPQVRKVINPLLSDSSPRIPRRVGVQERDPKIVLYLSGAAEVLLSDPLGRRTGFDPAGRRSYGDIPDAVYDSSGLGTLQEDGSIMPERDLTKEFDVQRTTDGEYSIAVTGTGAAPYTLSILGYGRSWQRSSSFTVTGAPILPGEVQRYRFRFTAADPTTDAVWGDFSGEERGELDGLLTYSRPSRSRTVLRTGTRTYGVVLVYDPGIDAGTFRALLNDTPVTSSFHPVPGHGEVVVLTLKKGVNRLDLSVGAQGATGTDRDRLTFVVQ